MAARLADLRAKRVAAAQPPSLPQPVTPTSKVGGLSTNEVHEGGGCGGGRNFRSIAEWLEAVRPGYGKFAPPFVECGYDDMEMLCDIRVSRSDAFRLFTEGGAKPPQALMIEKALDSVGAISNDAPQVFFHGARRGRGPTEWLESVKKGYGRFAHAFAATGYEDLQDITVCATDTHPVIRIQHLCVSIRARAHKRTRCSQIPPVTKASVTRQHALVAHPSVSVSVRGSHTHATHSPCSTRSTPPPTPLSRSPYSPLRPACPSRILTNGHVIAPPFPPSLHTAGQLSGHPDSGATYQRCRRRPSAV